MNKRLTIEHQGNILTVDGPEAEVDLLLKWIKDYRHGETSDNSVTCQSSLDLCLNVCHIKIHSFVCLLIKYMWLVLFYYKVTPKIFCHIML